MKNISVQAAYILYMYFVVKMCYLYIEHVLCVDGLYFCIHGEVLNENERPTYCIDFLVS